MKAARKIKRNKKIFAVLTAFCTLITTSIAVNAATTITQFRDSYFYEASPQELFYINEDCDFVTFVARCDGNTPDTVTCHITDMTHGGVYNSSFIFVANGTATLYEYAFPSGQYKIYFTGNANILKTSVVADFSKNAS